MIALVLSTGISLPGTSRAVAGVTAGGGGGAFIVQEQADDSRWRLMLDQLSDEARKLRDAPARARVMAEIADAYWEVDEQRGAAIFIAAMQTALGLDSPSAETNEAMRYVVKLAAIRDSELAKRLTEQAAKYQADGGRLGTAGVEAAVQLLAEDPERAAALAESSAPAGLSDGTAASLILALAEKNLSTAQRVYRTYLRKVSFAEVKHLGQLMWLAGFGLGYGEAYGAAINDPAQITGFGGRALPGDRNLFLVKAFLSTARQAVVDTLRLAAIAPAAERDSLNGMALFAVNYVIGDVARYDPGAYGEWNRLRTQALLATPGLIRQEVERQLQIVMGGRGLTQRRRQQADRPGDDKLAAAEIYAEKLPAGCYRDQAFAEVAISIAAAKDYTRALESARQIRDLPLRERVTHYVYYEMSRLAAEGDDLAKATDLAGRLAAKEQRVLLYCKIALEWLRRGDRAAAMDLLTSTRHVADGIEDRGKRTAALLALANAAAEPDPITAFELVNTAIQTTNQMGSERIDDYAIDRRVNLDCMGGSKGRLAGSADKTERFSLFGTLARVSASDSEGAVLAARYINDVPTRMRALTAIAKAMLKRRGSNSPGFQSSTLAQRDDPKERSLPCSGFFQQVNDFLVTL